MGFDPLLWRFMEFDPLSWRFMGFDPLMWRLLGFDPLLKTQLGSGMISETDYKSIEKDLDNLSAWSEKSRMNMNEDKRNAFWI